MSTNDPTGPSSFEPPKPHELAPDPAPDSPTPSEAAGTAEAAAADAQAEAADAAASADAATSAATVEPAAAVEPTPAVSEPVTAVTPVVAATAEQPIVPEPTAVTPVTAPVVVAQAAEPTTTKRKHSSVRVLAILVVIAGVIMIAAGGFTWYLVHDQLSDEKITVSSDASHFAGDAVDSPWTAYAQADTIKQHALEAGGGKTYAELPQDDPKRDTVMTASFLRASLYTSVVSFGVAVFAAGVGLILILIGWALLRVDKSLRRL